MFDRTENLVKGLTQKIMSNKEGQYKLLPENVIVPVKILMTQDYIEINGVSTFHPLIRIDGSQLSRRPSIKDQIVVGAVTWQMLDVRNETIPGAFTLLIKKVG